MGIFNRNEGRNRGSRGGYDQDLGDRMRQGWDRVEQGFRGRDPNDIDARDDEPMRGESSVGGGYGRGYGADYGGGQGMRGGRNFPSGGAGWQGGGMDRGGMDRGGMGGGGMGRGGMGGGGGMDRGGWNQGWGGREQQGGSYRGGGYDREMHGGDRDFVDRTADSVRRGWNDMTGRDDHDRGYRGGSARYGADYGSSRQGAYGGGSGYDPGFPRDRGYDRHEYKSRQQTDAGDPFGDRQRRTPIRMVNEDYTDRLARRNAYDDELRRDRDWF